MHPLQSLSPLDGRYHSETEPLQKYFSEMSLMNYRLIIEIEYFIALSEEKDITEFPEISSENQEWLRKIYTDFSLEDAEEIKNIEHETNHDVKAIEYFLQKKLSNTELAKYSSFLHFALTSEDINNLAYSLMWQQAISHEILPRIENILDSLNDFSATTKTVPLLGMTHGQPASTTTIGKEIFVFVSRLERQKDKLKKHKYQGKLSGATGTWAAHTIAYPQINWKEFSSNFISSLGLEPNLFTTQIESHDSLIESFHTLHLINSILLDFSRDMWLYISRGIFLQKKQENEVGSSTMPHKINPIYFENAEGNIGIANALFSHFADKLPISRMQRDLSDSTVLRNLGVPLGHSILAITNILKGLSRLEINKQKLEEELRNNLEILAEPIQTILRKYGDKNGYEKLKDFTRGEKIRKESLFDFIETLNIPGEEKDKLHLLLPENYTGYAGE